MSKALMVFSAHEIDSFTSFFVEELKPNGRWRPIPDKAGPYTSAAKAAKVAQEYSIEHGVKTRVTAEV
jgi:hypothetical protein